MNRIELSPNYCCGCSACANVCANGAITIKEDERGFLLPFIDEDKCVDCGLCKKVCDFKKVGQMDNNTLHAYSLVHSDEGTLKNSTSGGAFTALSDVVLKFGGKIVGALMEDDFSIHHVITGSESIRNKMRGSKYVQSDMSDIYTSIKDTLNSGCKVLFIGTPCQCAAVKSFFALKSENLYVVDFLCHGVPNNKMFKEHINFLEEQYGKKIVGFSFRDKRYGWGSYNSINFNADGTIDARWINRAYCNFFLANLSLRDSCYNCKYRSLYRPSDITIADFWGIEKLAKKYNHAGVSMVLTHSDKGEELLNQVKSQCEIVEYPFDRVVYRMNDKPVTRPNRYAAFWDTYKVEGYSALVKKFFDNSFKSRARHEIRKIAKLLRLC